MHKDYPNMMAKASHIRQVGPHAHKWRLVGVDSRQDRYETCQECGTRRARTTVPGSAPLRQDWLDGAPWEGLRAPLAKLETSRGVDAQDDKPVAANPQIPPRRKPGPKPGARRKRG